MKKRSLLNKKMQGFAGGPAVENPAAETQGRQPKIHLKKIPPCSGGVVVG